MRVAVFGASGMLGAMVLSYLSRQGLYELIATGRDSAIQPNVKRIAPDASFRLFDAEASDIQAIAGVLAGCTYAINCIGIIKPYIKDDNAAQVQRAIRVNSLFPHLLAAAAERSDCKVLQIATDCVYSGTHGSYNETSPHDALDVYGKTKSLGEVSNNAIHHLRCSIIGPELKAHVSLLDWFRGQSQAAHVKGFANHNWNGVTTLHFGKVCHGIISSQLEQPRVQHIIPSGAVTKAELLRCFAKSYGRLDVNIEETSATTVIDRTLSTLNGEKNLEIWHAAGYMQPPTVAQMVEEMAEYERTSALVPTA